MVKKNVKGKAKKKDGLNKSNKAIQPTKDSEGKAKKKKEKITKEMTLGEVVSKYHEAAEVMLKHGLHCVGCHMAAWETIGQGAAAHGITGKELEKLLKEMNDAVSGE